MKYCIRKLGTLLLTVCVIFSMLPPCQVEASEASVSGYAQAGQSEYFSDEDITVKLTVNGKAGIGTVVPSDIVLIMDRSGSMAGKIDSLKTAATQFVDKISMSSHRIGIVSFASDTAVTDFTTDKTTLKTVIGEMVASGGTNTASAINEAVAMLQRDKREDAKPVIVILTDGQFDTVAAAEAAKKAIENDFTFYTIALLDNPDNAEVSGTADYTINQQLKNMATSAKYHYSVGVDTLNNAYSDIAGAVGQANPYNLVVTQTLAEGFEFVPGSADGCIPVPTISGQTITWEMKELAGRETFTYQIRAKAGTVAGTYDKAITGNVYYETYEGNSGNSAISPVKITLFDTKLDITSCTPDNGIVGDATRVSVKGNDFHFKDDFQVTVGGTEVTATNKTTTTFAFKTPTDLSEGTYDILIYNSKTPQKIGTFTYTPQPKEETLLDITKFTPNSGEEGETTTIWVYGNDMQYETTFRVTIGGVEVAASNKTSTKFKIKAPTSLVPGTYDVVVYNGKDATGQTIGQYTVTEKIPVMNYIDVTKITPNSGEEGEAVIMWVYGKNMDFETVFRVEIGGVKVTSSNFSTRKFKIKAPTTLVAGTYDIIAYNGDGALGQTIGQYTVTAKTPVMNKIDVTKISPNSGEEGEAVIMWVYGNSMDYESVFKVEIGGVAVTASNKTSSKFKIIAPTTLAIGTYDIVVYNGDGALGQTIGQYTVAVKVPVMNTLNVKKISPNSGNAGETVIMWVYGNNMDYETVFKVEIGGVAVSASNKTSSKFKIKSPTTLTTGTYDIVVYNGDGALGQTIGTYTVN